MPAAAPAVPAALPLGNYYWVLPEQLLAGEHPWGATPELTRERLAALTAAGISCFIDLTEPQETPAYAHALPPGALYQRRPIPDHGLPADAATMTAILECILAALRGGQRVYLHCRAGIGRTGMTIGCLLAEGGVGGEVAIEELNRLWHASPRARQWPSIPETDAQTAYVRSWSPRAQPAADPLLEPATLAAARGLRTRYLGALLGLATGDAVGAATQYRRPGRFTPVGDLLGGGPFDLPRGAARRSPAPTTRRPSTRRCSRGSPRWSFITSPIASAPSTRRPRRPAPPARRRRCSMPAGRSPRPCMPR